MDHKTRPSLPARKNALSSGWATGQDSIGALMKRPSKRVDRCLDWAKRCEKGTGRRRIVGERPESTHAKGGGKFEPTLQGPGCFEKKSKDTWGHCRAKKFCAAGLQGLGSHLEKRKRPEPIRKVLDKAQNFILLPTGGGEGINKK